MNLCQSSRRSLGLVPLYTILNLASLAAHARPLSSLHTGRVVLSGDLILVNSGIHHLASTLDLSLLSGYQFFLAGDDSDRVNQRLRAALGMA